MIHRRANFDPMVGTQGDNHKYENSALYSGTPHRHDVLCGRGGQTNTHPGNEWFRRLVRSNRPLYHSCPKHTKLLVAKAIVEAIQRQDPPGRFIKLKESEDGTKGDIWEPIPYKQAVNKTSQALREKDSRDNKRNEKRNQSKTACQKSQLQAAKQEKKLEIANQGSKLAKDAFAQKPENSASPSSQQNGGEKTQQQTIKMAAGDPADAFQSIGQKRKARPSLSNAIGNTSSDASSGSISTPAPGAIVTPGIAAATVPGIGTAFDGEDGNKRIKGMHRIGNTELRGENNGSKNMGRGVVNQMKKPASSLPTSMDSTPFPMETTLGSRQSSLFRFFNNTGIFGRASSNNPAQAMGGKERPALQSPSVSQQTESGTISNSQYQQQQQLLMQPSSSGQRMGRTSVQQLRNTQRKKEQIYPSSGFENEDKVTNSIPARTEDQLEEIPTSGLMMLNAGHNAVPPPPSKGLKSQMSDWLTVFFPSPKKGDGPQHNATHASSDAFGSSLQSNIDNEGSAVPPPPGGGAGLGRSVSSAIFGLVESPSLLLNTLKSGVSSVFGDSVFASTKADGMPAPIRRFPSGFQPQQMRQQQHQQNLLPQQFGGNVATGDEMIGNHPILGERAKRRASLLEDFEETPMEKELRNAKPEGRVRGSYRW